jgi:hypothetical protein
MAIYKVGDMVHPGPMWRDKMNLPSGPIKEILPWGRIDGLIVGSDPTPYVATAFELDSAPQPPPIESSTVMMANLKYK